MFSPKTRESLFLSLAITTMAGVNTNVQAATPNPIPLQQHVKRPAIRFRTASRPLDEPGDTSARRFMSFAEAKAREAFSESDNTFLDSLVYEDNESCFRQILETATHNAEIAESTKNDTWRMWRLIQDHTSESLAVPHIDITHDGRVLLSWLKDEHYLDIEIIPSEDNSNSVIEFFYRNRKTNEAWGYDLETDDIPGWVLDSFQRYVD